MYKPAEMRARPGALANGCHRIILIRGCQCNKKVRLSRKIGREGLNRPWPQILIRAIREIHGGNLAEISRFFRCKQSSVRVLFMAAMNNGQLTMDNGNPAAVLNAALSILTPHPPSVSFGFIWCHGRQLIIDNGHNLLGVLRVGGSSPRAPGSAREAVKMA